MWRNRPLSRGTIRLATADDSDPVRIDPNYLSDPSGMAITKRAVQEVRRIFSQPAFDPSRGAELVPDADL